MQNARSQGGPPPQAVMLQMLMGRWLAHVIGVAAELGLADHVAAGPRTVADIAQKAGTNPDATYRVLRALASVGIFTEPEPGTFASTPLSETLRGDVPGTLRAMAVFTNHPTPVAAWTDLAHSVKTGGSALAHTTGKKPWDVFGQKPLSDVFNAAMTSMSAMESGPVVASYDFSRFDTLVDVGGGAGLLLSTVLAKHPQLRGVIFDLPHVVDQAKSHIQAAGLASRCEVVAGSVFETSPPPADAYIMKHILHDWHDDGCLAFLKSIHRVAKPGATLLVVEHVLARGNDPQPGKFLDLEMLVMTEGGRERSEQEFKDLCAKGGFELVRVHATSSPVSVVETRRVG